MDTGSGDRLRAFIEARWTRRDGGLRGLCRKIGVVPETLYGWLRGDNDPSLGGLAALADALGVSRWQIVAAMDGETEIVPLDDRTRQAIREEVRAAVAEDRAQRGSPREQSGAA